jgi:hypothetical protein
MIDKKKLRDKAEQHIKSYPPIKLPAKTLVDLLDEMDRLEENLILAHQKIDLLLSELNKRIGGHAFCD